MTGFLQRQVNVLEGLDEAINAECGGSPRETISGTVGRACGDGGGKRQWWGPAARAVIEVQPWFGNGHCAHTAEAEARRRQAEASR